MHLITEDPAKGKDLSKIHGSVPPKKPSLGRAIKNKIIDKTSDLLSLPARKYHESLSRGYQKQYDFAKSYQAKAKSGVLSTKDRAIMQSLKEK